MKHYIFNNVPFNTNKSKLDDMIISDNRDYNKQILDYVSKLSGKEFVDIRCETDTFTYIAEILSNKESKKYLDEPYIESFLVDGSDTAVVVIPGGGFAYKSCDVEEETQQGEGDKVALLLNKLGINAFVVHYRSNPYKLPIPMIDCQRAIKYIKHNSQNFHISPQKIGVVGFSAGGLIGGCLALNIDYNLNFPKDEIDDISPQISFVGLIYPCINFKDIMPMMSTSFNYNDVIDVNKRNELLEKYNLINYLKPTTIPHFICYGEDDGLVQPNETIKYIEKLNHYNIKNFVLPIPNYGHGFGCNGEVGKEWLESFVTFIHSL